MNAVIAPTKKAAAKRATAAPAPAPLTTAPDPVGAAFRQISVHLRNAAYAEADGGLQSGHSTRLLRTSASMAGTHSGCYWAGGSDGGNEAYDIAALVIAALHVEKDRLDSYALDEIRAATALLAELTEDDNVLEGALEATLQRYDAAPADACAAAPTLALPVTRIPREELEERIDLAVTAAAEIQEWVGLIAPAAQAAIFDVGHKPGQPDWHALASTVFARIATLTAAIQWSSDANEFPTAHFRQVVVDGKSVEATHWEADLMERFPSIKETGNAA